MGLPSSKVNDHICDCCDGSDENNGATQCEDVCGLANAAALKKYRAGREMREKYIAMGSSAAQQAEAAGDAFGAHDRFGKQREFWPLNGQCYSIKSGVFDYKMCPYGDATQTDSNGENVLGHWEKWAEDKPHTMLFTGGAPCGETPRSLSVHVECGLEDAILSESEPTMCQYAMQFTSPAACDDMAAMHMGIDLEEGGEREEL
jgi:hypothetical protein